ncbi:MAG: Phenol hydroxylase P5 protein [Dehalococcoidia bacterium]|nr:Phenol hydroxylase P5 protein [Chloroflexota bacterium]
MSSRVSSVPFYIKTNRSFSLVRRYVWFLTILIGIGGQFVPVLGLLVPFIMAALIGMSLFKGKYWCGNFCPHGSFFDNLLQPISRHVKIPDFFRSRLVIAAVLLFFMYNMTTRFIRVYGALGTAEFYERLGFMFANTYLMVLLIGGLLAVVINPRTWCQLCPMGTMQVIFYKLGKALGLAQKTDERVVVEHPDLCHSCGKCARVCPIQLTPYLGFSQNHRFEDESCIRCYTCINNCPAGILHMANVQKTEELKQSTSLDGFSEARYHTARIKSIRELKDGIREYTFELIDPPQMPYDPGQFVLVEIDKSMQMYRAYTISGSSSDNTEIRVTVKRLEDGYGTNLLFNNFQEGDTLTLKGPMGRELRVDPAGDELLFIANGIGVTPFVATVQRFFERRDYKFEGKAVLLYGARYEEDLLYDDYFESVAVKNGSFDYRKILSRPRTDQYRKGYVTDILQELDLSPATKVYICGTPEMAGDAKKKLREKGILEKNFFYESSWSLRRVNK